MNTSEIQYKVKSIALDMQSLARTVMQDDFVKAWEHASDASRERAIKMLVTADRAGMRKWIKEVLSAKFDEDKSVRELRAEAKAQGVAYYHHLNKAQLMEALGGSK